MLVTCDKLRIYEEINSDNFCFRRLNATHEIGCHSASETSGVLHYIQGNDDISFITDKGPHPPYVPIVRLANLSTSLLLEFKRVSHRIAGVIILKDASTVTEDDVSFSKVESSFTSDKSVPAIYSPETSCPNSKFSLYPENECRTRWVAANPALEMMSYSYPFSMILLTQQNDTNRVVDCFFKFNFDKSSSTVSTSWPLCAAQVTSSMYAAVNTPTCMARIQRTLSDSALCAPLQSRNIIVSTASLDEQLKPIESNVIFLVARMDSLSMFEEVSPGAYSTIPGILALLSIAETVSRTLRTKLAESSPSKTIYFALLDGEAFGYIGSSALVWQINEQQSFDPIGLSGSITSINMSNIHSVIELNQVAATNGSSDIWLHTDRRSLSNPKTNMIMEKLVANSKGSLNVLNASGDHLPPSSLMSFLKVNRSLAVVHITNHKETYITPHFNSFIDEPSAKWEEEFVDHILKLTKIVSSTVLEMMDLSIPSDLQVTERDNMKQLAHCLLFNTSCSLFREPIRSGFSQYVSVAVNSHRLRMTANLYDVLARWTGRERSDLTSKKSCDRSDNTSQTNEFIWINGTCIEAYTFFTNAVSPAFSMRQWNSTVYSTWSESYWTPARARIFLVSNPLTQWFTFLFGCVLVLSTWLFVSYLQRNHSTLFVS